MKFCPLVGKLVDKSDDEVKAEEKMNEDKITLIGDTFLETLKTEYDYPSNHPELGNKVSIFDMGVLVEKLELSVQGLDNQLHTECTQGVPCLLRGVPLKMEENRGLETEPNPAHRLVPQVYY